jgi:hypothetical protein
MAARPALLCAGILTVVIAAGANAQSLTTTTPAVTPASATAPVAGAQKIDGTYEFKQSVMTEPGGSPIEVTAKLVLTISGDSANGSWVMPIPGREAKSVALRGTVKGNTVTLSTGTQQARLQGPDGERTIDVSQEYILTVNGDTITGEIIPHSSDDSVELPSRPVTGKRASAPPASGSRP